MISIEKLKILTPLQKLPKNIGDLGKTIVAALKSCLKSNKSPNLVTWSHELSPSFPISNGGIQMHDLRITRRAR